MNKPDFNKIAPWCDIEPVTIAGQSFVKIPRFYYKCGVDVKGRVYWIMSGSPFSGGKVYPLFDSHYVNIESYQRYDYQRLNYIYIGAYQNSIIDMKENVPFVGSVAGNKPYVANEAKHVEAIKASQSIYKEAGMIGVDLANFRVHSAITMLCLIESGHSDVKSIWGKGNIDTGVIKPTGTSNDCYRGFYDLWGNVPVITGRGQLGSGGTAGGPRPYKDGISLGTNKPGSIDTMKVDFLGVSLQQLNFFQGIARDDINNPNPYCSYTEQFSGADTTGGPLYQGGSCNLGNKSGLFSYFTNIPEGASRTICIDTGALQI